MKSTFFYIKRIYVLLLLLGITTGCTSDGSSIIEDPDVQSPATTSFPYANWEKISNPEEAGYSSSKLALLDARLEQQQQTAVLMVIVKGKILYEKGNIHQKYQSHSLRKSFLSALYGNYVADGTINLNSTLASLSIDDIEGLTADEKQAKVINLLKARSGVYHPALYETESMATRRPDRGEYAPGAHWYYNNWDFNVLGTIFMQQTTKDIYEAIEAELAIPLQMSFKASDGTYAKTPTTTSEHWAYPFRISASDLARFGLLMLNKGKWREQQIIPEAWVAESTAYYSDASDSNSSGYGYMWWVSKIGNQYPLLSNVSLPEKAYMASGVGGQVLLVIPEYEMVISHRVNTDTGHSVSNANIGRLVQLVLDARL